VPEGDTLRRAEAALAPVLEGATLTDVWFRKLRGYRPRPGMQIASVDAVGKHLLIEFVHGDHRLVLRTHLGMSGSWRTIPPGRRAPSAPTLRVVLGTDRGTALCFAAPDIETHLVGASSPIDRLGPDLSDDDVDLEEVLVNTRATDPTRVIADVLLDQRIAAGVGNVFKSESLFVAAVHPFTPVRVLDDDALARLWGTAHRQLVANRTRDSRTTTRRDGRANRTYVYGRHRLGCRVCDAPIAYDPARSRSTRSTYWCTSCNGPG
jgi:endonuclease-8